MPWTPEGARGPLEVGCRGGEEAGAPERGAAIGQLGDLEGPFILGFPMGLMLYWVTTNLWTTGQGVITRRIMPKAQPPQKRSSRTPPKDEGTAGNGAKEPSPEPTKPAPGQQQPVRRVKRKKKAQRR